MLTTTLVRVTALGLTAKFGYVRASPALITVGGPIAQTASEVVVGGVDSLGRITYLIPEDEMQGSSTIQPLTATLVAAADHAFYTLAASGSGLALTLGFDCGISGANAICSDVDESAKPFTTTISAEPFVLDIVTTAAVGGSGSDAGSDGAPTKSGSVSASPTAQPSDKPGSAGKTSASAAVSLAVVGAVLVVAQLI
ncbi:hypothetical protein C8R46DRAFT_1352049 [Mycena filopes]|nr:hypothetical protein C8R46DRAFT_1352049 [Mycena filopes]